MALRYSFARAAEADRLDKAIASVLDKGLRTRDIASEGTKIVSTGEMGDAIVAELRFNLFEGRRRQDGDDSLRHDVGNGIRSVITASRVLTLGRQAPGKQRGANLGREMGSLDQLPCSPRRHEQSNNHRHLPTRYLRLAPLCRCVSVLVALSGVNRTCVLDFTIIRYVKEAKTKTNVW